VVPVVDNSIYDYVEDHWGDDVPLTPCSARKDWLKTPCWCGMMVCHIQKLFSNHRMLLPML